MRDTWEISNRKIRIDEARWKRTLEPVLKEIGHQLGLPGDGKLSAVLDKLLVYTPGQFFAAHQDSERADDMIGSLVVELPSRSSGGSVLVHHQGQKRIFRGAKRGPKDLSLLAFYADCHHEVKPITSGYRVVLTWHLLHRAAASHRVLHPGTRSDDLTARAREYFSTAVAPRYGNRPPERPDRLIYLLDHQYTEKSLGWTRLKNGDRLRVAALRQAAEQLDCESYLVLADVHENWSCEEEGYDWRGHSRDDEFDDEDSTDKSSEHTLGELCDSSVELRHWVGPDGPAPTAPSWAAADEICFTTPSVDFDPFQSEHEGYMGNYGNTVDRWYHRAAFVMWPRARNFVIRAKESPAWAVGELATKALSEAREAARSLLPFWAALAPGEETRGFFGRLLKVAVSLDDSKLAQGLLAPLGPHRLTARTSSSFASLVERHGAAWSQGLFETWSQRARYDARDWLSIIPDLFDALILKAPTHGTSLAAWLLAREVNAFEQQRLSALESETLWLDQRAGAQTQTLLALFRGAAVIEDASARERLVTLLTSEKTALGSLDAGALLEAALEAPDLRRLGLHAIHRAAVELLERTLAIPPRAPEDWSIDLRVPCRCELCAGLSAFLRDKSRVEYAWPLAQERRGHVLSAIDRHQLPVTHTTLRRGRPHSLVLTKQKALFARETQARARKEALLVWLRAQREAFAA